MMVESGRSVGCSPTLFGQTGMESYVILGKLLQFFRFKSGPFYAGEYELCNVR